MSNPLLQVKIGEVIGNLFSRVQDPPTFEELPTDVGAALTHYAASLATASGDVLTVASALYGALVVVWREGVRFGRFLGPV